MCAREECESAGGSSRTPSVVFKMSLKFSSFKYSNESSGISTLLAPMLSHAHRPAKRRQVAKSLGREEYQGLLLFAASKVAPGLGDINPKVSIDMRRPGIARRRSSSAA